MLSIVFVINFLRFVIGGNFISVLKFEMDNRKHRTLRKIDSVVMGAP